MPRLNTDDPRVGTVLSERYRIDALVGEGGMGKVYRAEHVKMKKRLAVKVLHRELTSVPELVTRFEREAMAVANIEHPNVAAATDFGKLDDGCLFLVLEFVEGKNLRDEIAEGPMPLERALHIARQIAAGLGSAHAQGIVHRDLKPENVMLVQKGDNPDWVKVLDFGIAKVPIGEVPTAAGQPITRAGMVFGTPEYMAPEQALGQAVDGRADLYALGVILFEMLAGVRPFSSANTVGLLGQQLAGLPPTLSERAPGSRVPPAVEQIVQRLLASDRDQRFSDAAEVVSAIDLVLTPTLRRGGFRFTLSDGSPSELDGLPLPQPKPVSGTSATSSALGELKSLGPSARSEVGPVLPMVRSGARWIRIGVMGAIAVGAIALAFQVNFWMRRTEGTGRAAEPSERAPISSVMPQALALSTASAAELATALRQGPEALEALTIRYPGDPGPSLEAARAYASNRDSVGAVAAVGRALAIDPAARDDARAVAVLFQSSQQAASADASFALLTGSMGSRGAEILWDLAAHDSVEPLARQRAAHWLRSPAFRERASAPLGLAADLRTAKSCEAARALLPRAQLEADQRSLSQLEAWKKTTGCGKKRKDDCMPCLRKDGLLEQTIAAIQNRARLQTD